MEINSKCLLIINISNKSNVVIVNEIENKFTFEALHGIVVIGNFAK